MKKGIPKSYSPTKWNEIKYAIYRNKETKPFVYMEKEMSFRNKISADKFLFDICKFYPFDKFEVRSYLP
jgi:hypothetical protein